MKIFNKEFSIFGKKEEESVEFARDGVETAISETSNFYTSGDFPKYNPDDLIGRKGFGIYKKMCQDEQVKAGLKFKRDAITARGFTFQLDPEESGLSEEECRRRVKICENIVEEIKGSFMDSVHKILSAMQNGFSITEIVYTNIEVDNLTYRGLKYLKLKPADTFLFNVDEYGNIDYIEQQVLSEKLELDYDKFIHFVVNPDVDEHYGESELRACYRAWFSKDVAIKLRNIYLERHAGGFYVIKPPKDKSLKVGTAEYNSLVSLLRNITVKTGVILPSSDYELEGKYPSGSGADIFEKTIDQCDLHMARALLLPNLLGVTPTGQTGSYSQSETQLDAFFWTLSNDSERLAEVLNDQLFRNLGSLNFQDGIYPKFKWNPLSKTKAIELIRIFMELVSKRVLKNTPEDEDFIRSALELPSVDAYVSEEEEPSEDNGDQEDVEDMDEENAGSGDDEIDESDEEEHEDETIVGRKAISIANSAFKRATSRVSFAVIGTGSEGIVADNVSRVTDITDQIIQDVIEQAKAGGELDDNIVENFKNVKIPAKSKSNLNSSVTKVLKEAERFGRKEASKEIDKAMKQSFSLRADYKRMDFIADDYFKAASFRITGNVTDEITKVIENSILNGARYDKTWDETEKAIYETLATKGMVSVELAKDKLGQDLNVETPDARMRTIVRTSTFEAINTARDSYFTDPQLGDFVRAYEYSAILDSATTSVCRHLDSDGAGDHSVQWYNENAGFKPPNHFNCRSLLVAVTVNDLEEFEEGPQPSIEPMEGFK